MWIARQTLRRGPVESLYSLTDGMDHYPFRPHWRHRHCGGVVTGVDDLFKCLTCNMTGNAVGAFLPGNVTNSTEYFSCTPELEVQFVDASESFTAQVALLAGHGTRNRWQVREKLCQLVRWRSKPVIGSFSKDPNRTQA